MLVSAKRKCSERCITTDGATVVPARDDRTGIAAASAAGGFTEAGARPGFNTTMTWATPNADS